MISKSFSVKKQGHIYTYICISDMSYQGSSGFLDSDGHLSKPAGLQHLPGFFDGFDLLHPLRVFPHHYVVCFGLISDHTQRPVRFSLVNGLHHHTETPEGAQTQYTYDLHTNMKQKSNNSELHCDQADVLPFPVSGMIWTLTLFFPFPFHTQWLRQQPETQPPLVCALKFKKNVKINTQKRRS